MIFNRIYIRKNITLCSIIIFIIAYSSIVYIQPGLIYNGDGSLREFGLNSSKKTVIPVWLLAILLALSSYFIVMYYLAMPKLIY